MHSITFYVIESVFDQSSQYKAIHAMDLYLPKYDEWQSVLRGKRLLYVCEVKRTTVWLKVFPIIFVKE